MRKNKKWMAAAVISLAVLGGTLTACGQKQGEPENVQTSAEAETETEADTESSSSGLLGTFTSVTLAGEEVNQDIFSNADLTMVNIWGTFCGPCIAEMPDLGELSREYKDKGFQIVGIVSDITDPTDANALEIVESTKADYTHMVLSEELYNNYLALVTVVPTTVFLDKDGKQVGTTYAGSKSKARWKKIIDELLEKVQE